MSIVYIGTYTEGRAGGIHAFRFDPETGKLSAAAPVAQAQNPSYLAVSPDGRRLYSVLETTTYEGRPGGAVGAFAIDGGSGALPPVNIQPTEGREPCHIVAGERFLYAANYGEGTVTEFPLNAGGSIAPLSKVIRHRGSGPNADRQEGPHAHCSVFTPDGKYLCAVDLGCDSVFVYTFSPESGISSVPAFTVKLRPGSGPRHIVFSPSGKFAYIITELSNEVVAFAYSPVNGFTELQYISTLPEGYAGKSWCAAVHIAHGGKTLYASNREHDSIAVFRIDDQTGKLELLQVAPTQGRWPRDFAFDTTGRWLLAANQKSDNIVVFRIGEDGRIGEAVGTAEVPMPACVRFA